MKDVKQKIFTAGVEDSIVMDGKGSSFLVKNFTDSQIRVRLGDNESFSTIGPSSWENVFNNIDETKHPAIDVTDTIHIESDGDGMVEVARVE